MKPVRETGMMLALIVMQAATPSVTPPTFTKDGIAAMTPAAIADAVLPAHHAPVSVIGVHPAGMEAPSASLTSIELRYVAAAAKESDFCAATVVQMPLLPVDPAVNAVQVATPVKPGVPTEYKVYRWTDRSDSCAAGAQPTPRTDLQVQTGYFKPLAGKEAETFAMVRQLAAARLAARRPGKLPFVVTFENRDPQVASQNGDLGNPRAALSTLPVEWVGHVGPASVFADLKARPAPAGETWWGMAINRDLSWTILLRMRGETLVGVDMVRRIPPPF